MDTSPVMHRVATASCSCSVTRALMQHLWFHCGERPALGASGEVTVSLAELSTT
jgi:hypothetical protein